MINFVSLSHNATEVTIENKSKFSFHRLQFI